MRYVTAAVPSGVICPTLQFMACDSTSRVRIESLASELCLIVFGGSVTNFM